MKFKIPNNSLGCFFKKKLAWFWGWDFGFLANRPEYDPCCLVMLTMWCMINNIIYNFLWVVDMEVIYIPLDMLKH